MLKVSPRSIVGSVSTGFITATDGTNTVANIATITLTGGTTNVSGAGSNADLNVQGLTITDNVTTITDVANIQVKGGKIFGNSSSVVLSTGDSLISEIVTANLQSSITFSNIASIYRDLVVIVRGRSINTVASNAVVVQITMNGDNANNYDTIRENRFGVFSNVNGGNVGVIGEMTAANAPANYPASTYARIFDYRGTTFFKQCQGQNEIITALAAASEGAEWSGTWWRNTAAITSLTITLSSNLLFAANCVASLYGCL